MTDETLIPESDDPYKTVNVPAQNSPVAVSLDVKPERIGRYRIERVLGRGGFGLVYLAQDEQLVRSVAIKVPHRKLVEQAADAEAYLTEARTVASLDHPHIVPVYDVGGTEEFPCFIVSKWIDGADLATRLKHSPLSMRDAAQMIATVADALHYAHMQGLVHRDIKPGNILLDGSGKSFVADFGLALREQDVGQGPRYAGTPAYMSPEQARGEGHRVDGRSDIFSLGVVLYELLTGRRPFRGESQEALLEQITSVEPRPPRQIDDQIPKELDRICQKALSKRASERYSVAKDLVDDLRHFLATTADDDKLTATVIIKNDAELSPAGSTPWGSQATDSRPIRIVPKGLRSFDAAEADFFLELLPGPRDRDGLPESIRFWKSRIEQLDEDTFAVGLIYGPSGCGKSSQVKAGLLPRLVKSVTAVYLEATADDTETRILKGLRRHIPNLPKDLGLVDSLSALRRGNFLESNEKVLLVLDQFEQWLHAWQNEQDAELVQALRHCNGSRLQCIVMVRDDFWMAAHRFMRELEISLEDKNSLAVDLFPIRHAQKVLAAFGRAFGELPAKAKDDTKEQRQFIEQTVAGLAQDGKVVSVRLALFAEMVKGKPWVPATLKEIGGTEGVGVTFLEETFTASTAPPQNRLHQRAAQAVLKALLPDAGTDIKGHMRSQPELLEASGYANRPKDFEELIRVLDSQVRLITPTDPEGTDGTSTSTPTGTRYYQLTHDYLVPSLRDWLTRKQKETRRGRTELLLADRSAVWNGRPENQQLPSLLQFLKIRWFTPRTDWTTPQRKMMDAAQRYHTRHVIATTFLLAFLGWCGYQTHGTFKAQALRDRLLDATTGDVPAIVQDMQSYRPWLDPLLREAARTALTNRDSRKQLHASLALLPVDDSQVDYLFDRLLAAEPHEVSVIREALSPYSETLKDRLWPVALNTDEEEPQRLRAAAALARYAPDHQAWSQAQVAVANDLVQVPAVYLTIWMDAFRPVRKQLIPQLSAVFRDAARPTTEHFLATDILADFASDNAEVLVDLLLDADEKQFVVIFPRLEQHGNRVLTLLNGEIDRSFPADALPQDRDRLARRQANAAVALFDLHQTDRIWPLLAFSTDPSVRSYLVHRLGAIEVNPEPLIERLAQESDPSVQRALLLSFGEFETDELTLATRNTLIPRLQHIYQNEADPGLHAAAEWLLRTWNQGAWLETVNQEWAQAAAQRDSRLESIRRQLASAGDKSPPQWYVNSEGHTLVAIPGPAQFVMGSPPDEAGRQETETPHIARIGHSFALATKSVTIEQYRRFDPAHHLPALYTRLPNLPVVDIDWFRAAAYCNWLSEQEGLPEDQWCYDLSGTHPQPKANSLSLAGYRLPTEMEIEYATRAGTVTSRFFGESEDLLPKYTWHTRNSQERPWPVGSLKPNDFGLFDILGNVYVWCQDIRRDYPAEAVTDDADDDRAVLDSTLQRVLRGGSFNTLPSNMRSAYRYSFVPTSSNVIIGFRIARTIVP